MLKKAMKIIVPAVLLSASLSVFALSESNSAPKIGIFDMQQMMQASPLVKQLNEKLQEEFKPRQAKIVAFQKNIGDQIESMNKTGSKMTVDQRNKLKDKLLSDRTTYQTMTESYQKDLAVAQNTAMQKLMGQLQTAVDTVAKKDGYSMVIQRGAVLYFDPHADVTQQVLQDLPK